MYNFYFDEAKPQEKYKQNYFLITGVGLENSCVANIVDMLNKIAKNFSIRNKIDGGIEFHGSDIIQGKRLYKDVSVDRRFNLYKEVLSLVNINRNIISLIYIWVDTKSPKIKYYNKHTPQDWALVFLVEKIDEYMANMNSSALLVGDIDGEVYHRNKMQFKKFKENKTYGFLGKNIRHITDLTYINSADHRLIQLADMINYARVVQTYEQQTPLKNEFKKLFKEYGWFPNKYKDWPQ